MKVLVIATKAITVNKFLNVFIRELGLSCKVQIYCMDGHEIEDSILERSELFGQRRAFGLNLGLATKVIEALCLIRKAYREFDIVMCHTPIISHLCRVAAIGLKKRSRIVYMVHGLRFIPGRRRTLKSSIFEGIEVLLARYTDKYIAINNLDYNYLKSLKGDRSVSLVNGVGVTIMENHANRTRKKGKLRVGFVASYKKEKGYEDLIDLSKNLDASNYEIITCGYGKVWESRNYSEASIVKHKGFIRDMNSFYEDIDVLLTLSKREGLNVSMQEAMGLGIPCVGLDVRGVRDLIKEGVNGYCIMNDDARIKRVQHALEDIRLMSDEEYSCMSLNTFVCAKKYDRNKLAEELVKAIKSTKL